jgi:NADPH:quinone reductase-like Zn-dependent oxidoreductase
MATLPETMLAIDPSGPGGPEVLRPVERPIPRPVEGELLIRVEAAGVNRPDILQRLGKYPPPPGASSIPGLEVSGRVAAVGPAMSAGWIGKRVCALVAGGGYAEYCTAPAGSCLNIPGPLTMVEGAALPETGVHRLEQPVPTWCRQARRDCSGSRRDQRHRDHGYPARPDVRGERDRHGRVRRESAPPRWRSAPTHAINYRDHDFLDEIERLTEGKGVDIVLDMIGGDYLLRNLRCLAAEGRHVSIAAQRGATPELPLWEVMKRRLTLTGSTLRARSVEFKSALAIDIQRQVWPNMETGRFRPVIDSVFPLAEAAEAHRRMESSLHIGKIVLQVGEMP